MTKQTENNVSREVLDSTTKIISSFTTHSKIPAKELAPLIKETYTAIEALYQKQSNQKPAVPIEKSITPDFIICLEDGKKFKSLKRHIRTHFNLSPEEYREKWNLPHNYPMVAPNYAKARSKLAKKSGLGQRDSHDEGGGPSPSTKTNGNKRTNVTSTRMVGAERGNTPAPS